MNTIREIWDSALNNYSELPAVRWLEKKDIIERSYRELNNDIEEIRKGLKAEGLDGVHISLIGTASISWIGTYLGITTGNNVAVPLDAGLPAEDLIELLNDSDAEALFLAPKGKALAEAVKASCPKIRKIWLLQEEPEEGFSTLADLKDMSKGRQDVEGRKAEDIATLIYTSGTTGKSKGVMLTQSNLSQNVESVPYSAEPGCVLLSVLPVHHAFCLVMDWLKGFSLGATVCINDSFMHIIRNMSIFKPDVMLMVPLMIETIYKRLSAVDPALPKEAVAANVFGGNLKIIFTGGAHLDPFYIEKLAEYGVKVLEGYGMSECSPVISSNTPEDHKIGSIGKPLPNVKVRFEDGEIQVQGSSVMKGYYKMPAETEETLKDGWLHTGDKGYLDEDGFLFINGRVKNLIILSNGENISPEEIENKLGINPLVGEVIVTGENNGLTARIYPDQDVVKATGLAEDAVKAALDNILKEYNQKQPTYRQIIALVVRKNPFHRNATGKIVRADAEIDE
ncbi:long-chain acyl-CoA synthetase [Lachnospiraceae bacterium]|nr:long-chain acyl-CoA synthetase [Lachnospiraceae bacterium]